jgi:hypothetical protein
MITIGVQVALITTLIGAIDAKNTIKVIRITSPTWVNLGAQVAPIIALYGVRVAMNTIEMDAKMDVKMISHQTEIG